MSKKFYKEDDLEGYAIKYADAKPNGFSEITDQDELSILYLNTNGDEMHTIVNSNSEVALIQVKQIVKVLSNFKSYGFVDFKPHSLQIRYFDFVVIYLLSRCHPQIEHYIVFKYII